MVDLGGVALDQAHLGTTGLDVGVLELRENARLTQEAGARFGGQPAPGTNGLDRDTAVQGLVEADVDLAHAPFSQEAQDANLLDVATDEGARLRAPFAAGELHRWRVPGPVGRHT